MKYHFTMQSLQNKIRGNEISFHNAIFTKQDDKTKQKNKLGPIIMSHTKVR